MKEKVKEKFVKELIDERQSLIVKKEKAEREDERLSELYRKSSVEGHPDIDLLHASVDAEKEAENAGKRISVISMLLGYLTEGKPLYVSRYLWSDVEAYEVIDMVTPTTWEVRELKATLTDKAGEELRESFVPGGFFGHYDNSKQDWEFESDTNNPVIRIRQHKDGYFYEAGASTIFFAVKDHPYKFYDHNF